mgnify:CR=1 FL=1
MVQIFKNEFYNMIFVELWIIDRLSITQLFLEEEENQRKELKSPEKEVNILPEMSPDTNKTPIHKQESKVEKFLNLLHVQNQSSTKNETLVNAAEQMSEEERENDDSEIDYKALYMKVKRDNRVLIDTIAIILKNR